MAKFDETASAAKQKDQKRSWNLGQPPPVVSGIEKETSHETPSILCFGPFGIIVLDSNMILHEEWHSLFLLILHSEDRILVSS